MASVTDDERRRVAAELRGMHDYETATPIIRTCLGLRPGMLMDDETRRRMSDRLADLIEPSCDRDRLYVTYSRSTCGPDGRAYMVRVCHRTKGWERDFCAVDREALLALADTITEARNALPYKTVHWTDVVTINRSMLDDIACRIREACGVVA